MKKIKLILFIVTAFTLLGIQNAHAQDKNPQIVIIKMYEFYSLFKSKMLITDPSGNTRTVELENIKIKSLENAVASNNQLLQQEINNWKREGFKIDALSNSGLGDNMFHTTIILSKDE